MLSFWQLLLYFIMWWNTEIKKVLYILKHKELFSFHLALKSQVLYVYFVMHIFFLFMHRPSVFSVQVKQYSEQHICIESCSKYQRLSYLWFEINMIWTKYLWTVYWCLEVIFGSGLDHSFYFFRLTRDFEKKWSRGDEIKIKIKPKNLYSRYTKYKKSNAKPEIFFFQLSLLLLIFLHF